MGKIGVLVIHGMGDQPDDFHLGFKEGITDYYEGDKSELNIQPIHWSYILNDSQRDILNKTEQYSLHYSKHLRPFVVNYLADVIAYQKTFEKSEFAEKTKGEYGDRGIYHLIQDLISSKIKIMKNEIGEDSPIVMVGHSLGSIMLLNYLHDTQKEESVKNSRKWNFEDKFNLVGLITMGSPLALWLLRYNNFGKAINFPLKTTLPQYHKVCRWKNYYDKDDILAYPLKCLNDTYGRLACLEDIEVNAGNILTEWNPLSHNGYFGEDVIRKEIAEYLFQIRGIIA